MPRLKRALTVSLADGWRGDVIDLSAVGLRVQCLLALQPGAEIDGELHLDGGEVVPLKGKVVWATPPDHSNWVLAEVGIELTDVSERYHRALAELFADEGSPP